MGQVNNLDLGVQLSVRKTSEWASCDLQYLDKIDIIKGIATGILPIGLFHNLVIFRDEDERLNILRALFNIPVTKYDGTDFGQGVNCWGNPFVDSQYLESHLTTLNIELDSLRKPLLERLKNYFVELGFNVEDLLDPITNLPYSAGVFRYINVQKGSSVLHIDDFVRDGLKKEDFRLPKCLINQDYSQLTFNILLDDGGYQPDSVIVYNRIYSSEDEEFVMKNGWQFPLSIVEDYKSISFTPSVGDSYVFSSLNYHDISIGHHLSNRVTFGLFIIYISATNTMYFYN